MTINKGWIPVLIAILGIIISLISWQFSQASVTNDKISDIQQGYLVGDARLEGRVDSLQTDIKYIKESLARIENKLDDK